MKDLKWWNENKNDIIHWLKMQTVNGSSTIHNNILLFHNEDELIRFQLQWR